MTIEFKPVDWTWTETTTKTETCKADPSASMHTRTTEKVLVRFEIVGAPDVVRPRTGRAVRYTHVELVFNALDGGPWTLGYRMTAIGNNVLKSGELGARVDTDYAYPGWLTEWAHGVRPLAWVLKMYPR